MSTPYWSGENVTLHHGDCIEVMAGMPANSIDAIVCDPPYGLGFMGKAWDDPTAQGAAARPRADGDHAANPYKRSRAEYGGSSYGGDHASAMRAFGDWCELWSRECLRVLKPGGHLLAFGGTRTWHRLAVAIEDAGFEIRDSIAWLYGSGFPKSLDVSKAIDKAAGAEREVIGTTRNGTTAIGSKSRVEQGYRPTVRDTSVSDITAPATDAAKHWAGWGTALKPAFEPIVFARKPLVGTVAGNVQAYGTGALNIDGCRIGTTDNLNGGGYSGDAREATGASSYAVKRGGLGEFVQPSGRWPANVVLDVDQAAALDKQTGVLTSGKMQPTHTTAGVDGRSVYGADAAGGFTTMETYGDRGGASRFFYVAKAPTVERPKNGEVAHPTVKPIDLMQWLVRLVTPPGGIVLDPFAGSGTTGEAAVREGFTTVLIEREADYLPLIRQRFKRPIDYVMDFGDPA